MKIQRDAAILLLIVTAGVFILRIILAFQGYFLEQVSGSWAALAVDFSKGMLYRPIFSDGIGTGGTRWMPLYFSLHGMLIKITGNVIVSGLMLSLLSALLLLTAIFLLLLYYKINPVSSVIILALALCSNNLLTAMTAVRGDILAAALNIWGIYFAVTSDKKNSKIILSCFFFSLAIITKLTSVFGIAAVVLWLFFNNRKKSSFKFAGIFSIITILFIITIQIVSSGRFMDIFTLCASGGTTIVKFAKSPFNFINCLTNTDPGVIAVLTLGLTLTIYKGRDIIVSQYSLYMAITLAITLFIFGSEGIVGNHLIDIHIAAVFVIAGFIKEYEIKTDMVIKCSFVVIILAFLINAHSLKQISKEKSFLLSIKETALSIDKTGSMISQNPWLPIIMDREIYMLDPWMFRLIEQKRPELLSAFYKRFDKGGFDYVVFDQNPLAPWIPDWFVTGHFGRNFLNHTFRYYKIRENHDMYYIYTPNSVPIDVKKGFFKRKKMEDDKV